MHAFKNCRQIQRQYLPAERRKYRKLPVDFLLVAEYDDSAETGEYVVGFGDEAKYSRVVGAWLFVSKTETVVELIVGVRLLATGENDVVKGWAVVG